MNLLMQKVAPAIILCFFIYLFPVFGQQNGPLADPGSYSQLVKKGYGLDQDLVNGLQYYNRHLYSTGHPYFQNDQIKKGSITIKGKIFYNVKLKFDIYSQNVELEYENISGGRNQVITIFDQVDAFTLGDFQFQKLIIEEGDEKYYQVISTACFTVYVFWEKGLLPLNGSTTHVEKFTDAKHSYLLDLAGELTPFNSRKDFSECFPEEDQKEIKRLLSRNQFKFRTAQVDQIVRNVEWVCNLLNDREKN
jgi:hypothetical protein